MGQPFRVIKIRHTACHAGPKVGTNGPQNHSNTAGHILTPVRSAAFDDNFGTRIAHGKPLTGTSSGKQIAVRRTVKNRVPDDRIISSDKRRMHRRTHHNHAAGQAFTNVVIGIAGHFDLQTRGRKGTKRLASRSGQFDGQMIRLQRVAHPEVLHDMRRNTGANSPVGILHRVGQLHLLTVFQEPRCILHNLGVESIWHRIAILVAVVNNLGCTIDGNQQRVQIEIIQMGRATADLRQQISTTNHIIQRPRTDRGQQFANLSGIEGNQINNLVRIASELGTQVFILRTHANRAGVRLTLTDHNATHRNQGSGADAIFLSTHHRSHHNVTARAQTSIGAQSNPVTQLVHRQNLMRLGQAHFPRQASIFDRRGRGRTGTAIMTRNQDHVSLGLGHTSSNRANTRRRHQLDSHLTARVDLLKIIDQLRQILDGIDVVMGRRRNQRHTLGRMAQTGNQVGDLHAGQLSTLTGLGALRNLDFQLFTLVQILGSHTKPARGDLLDLRRRIIAIGFGHKVGRVFTALTRIRLGTNAVHRDVQGLVGLRRQSTKRHSGRHKPLPNGCDRFHLFNRNRLTQGFDIQQIAQMNGRVGFHLGTELLPHLVRGLVTGDLQHVHAGGFPGMSLAGLAGFVKTTDGQHRVRRPTTGMNFFGLALNTRHTDATDTAGHTGEELRTHRAA